MAQGINTQKQKNVKNYVFVFADCRWWFVASANFVFVVYFVYDRLVEIAMKIRAHVCDTSQHQFSIVFFSCFCIFAIHLQQHSLSGHRRGFAWVICLGTNRLYMSTQFLRRVNFHRIKCISFIQFLFCLRPHYCAFRRRKIPTKWNEWKPIKWRKWRKSLLLFCGCSGISSTQSNNIIRQLNDIDTSYSIQSS